MTHTVRDSLHSEEDLRYWLALNLVPDIGPVTSKHLLSAFRTPQGIFGADLAELKGIENIGETRAKEIKEFRGWDKVEREIKKLRDQKVTVVTYADTGYPESLRHIDDSPLVIYMKGTFEEEDKYALALVGSRNMTDYGRGVAERMAFELASSGLTIVSGMARGIDTASHKGALSAGGRSIAVLGCGIDRAYPSENAKLSEALSQKGCIMSEFPLGTPPNKENFPKRNRLISGLSLGVLVVEATPDSGSLITARYALEQGKEVFAIPGNLTSRNSEGTNALIKRGAKLVQRTEDIFEEIAPLLKGLLKSPSRSSDTGRTDSLDRLAISEEEKAICSVLGSDPKHIDVIARETSTAPSKLLGLLLSLEIKGIVRQVEGKRYYRA